MIITKFKDTFHAYTTRSQIIDTDWPGVLEILKQFHSRPTKEQVPMFNLWEFKLDGEEGRKYHDKTRTTFNHIPNTIRRCAENAIGLWGFVIDYDGNKTMQEVKDEFKDFEFFIYTTFNHSTETEKFRVVMPFTRMLLLNDFNEKLQSISDTFKGCDAASFSVSQAIHMHSAKNRADAYTYHNKGFIIDPDWFTSVKAPIVISKPYVGNPLSDFAAYNASIMTALNTCSNVHRGANKGNGGGLTLAVIVKSIDGTFSDFQSLCMKISAPDSCLRTPSVQDETWRASGANERITKEKRDAFIKNHSGVIKTATKDVLKTSQELREAIIKKWGTGK